MNNLLFDISVHFIVNVIACKTLYSFSSAVGFCSERYKNLAHLFDVYNNNEIINESDFPCSPAAPSSGASVSFKPSTFLCVFLFAYRFVFKLLFAFQITVFRTLSDL